MTDTKKDVRLRPEYMNLEDYEHMSIMKQTRQIPTSTMKSLQKDEQKRRIRYTPNRTTKQ